MIKLGNHGNGIKHNCMQGQLKLLGKSSKYNLPLWRPTSESLHENNNSFFTSAHYNLFTMKRIFVKHKIFSSSILGLYDVTRHIVSLLLKLIYIIPVRNSLIL